MLSEANVWSRFEFQQLYQSSPLLSPNCFSLKQIPVLNLNCKDSLGFPSFFAQKDFLFSWFQPRSCRPKKGFLFLVSMTKKGLRHCSFRCPSGLLCIFKMFASFFWNFGWRALGPDWEFSGIPPAWVLLGGPSFFWDFGNTLNFGGPSFLGRP